MQRIVKVLAVAVLAATVLVMASIPAFARPVRGGLPVQNKELCEKMLAENHPRFAEMAPLPGEPTNAKCWHTSQGPGLVVASDPPPPDPPPVRD